MAAALAMAGTGLGSGSLVLQVVDECVKYYKYFSEASKMPEKHRYLQIRLQLEQQRFLVFAEEAGLLSTEAGPDILSINSTLLQETLSEIKSLFEMFQQANGKYVDIVLSDGLEKRLSPQPSMMDLLCATQGPIAKIDISVAPTAKTSLRSNSIFSKIIWKARKLRTIIVEPKRLVWVAFDQKAFTSLIANLEVLNSALISLLHSSRSRRINQAIQTSYQEIIQMKTDLQGLKATIQAITYNINQEEENVQSVPMPSLSLRISLCFQLAECLSNFHAVDWLHKGLRSQNILFFSPDVGSVDLQKPYLTGLELSRPDGRPELTDVAKPNPDTDLYRHPLVQGGENADAYRKSFDLYSLGIILLEVGCWSPIESIVGYKAVSSLTGDELRSVKDKILVDKNQALLDSEFPTKSTCLEVVSAHAGNTFRDILEILLCANEIESPAYPGEKAALRNRRLREAFAEGVVERLQKMREAL
ncbi:unnamed protein product [Clonostachys byssicola]|uniref:Protein kinase domain-containing protein n=1 Tax=Clonostachys byssicola TaxID=160290 RepID=A0A9N9XXE8_9HYPO|nr:unnamed protein product [Clonostachys byssicola]